MSAADQMPTRVAADAARGRMCIGCGARPITRGPGALEPDLCEHCEITALTVGGPGSNGALGLYDQSDGGTL